MPLPGAIQGVLVVLKIRQDQIHLEQIKYLKSINRSRLYRGFVYLTVVDRPLLFLL